MSNRLPSSLVGASAKVCKWFRSDYLRPGVRKWYKTRSARKMRRLAKMDPENAPRKYGYAGWSF